MKRGDCNFIHLDWSLFLANIMDQNQNYSTKNVWEIFFSYMEDIVRHTRQCIDELVGKKLFNLGTFHLVGYSIGAEISGLIASRLTRGSPARITGRIIFVVNNILQTAFCINFDN